MIVQNKPGSFLGAVCAVLLVFLATSPGLAQEAKRAEQERREEVIVPTTPEVIAAIKRRAQQILQERRRARQWRFSGEVSQLVGYESNPSNGTDHVGDTYFENSAYLALSKRLMPALTYQATYNGSFTNYVEYGDGDYTSQTLTPAKLTWQPGRMWRVDGGIDLNLTYYPLSGPSNYREFKPYLQVRQNLFGSWFHLARYEWFIRDYMSKKARTGAGADTLSDRTDARHRLRYEFGLTWWEALFRVKQEWYVHDSNDARNDFYDAQDYKVTLSANRNLTDKLSLNATYYFERKNYEHRPVTGNVTSEARYDDTQSWKLAGTYEFNDTWSLNPSFEYKFLDSNEPTGEYIDWIANASLTARF